MKNIWENKRISIIIAVFLILLFLTVFFLAVPFVSKIKEKADNIQKKLMDIQVSKDRISKIPQMEEIDRAYESKKNELDVVLDVKDQVEFIKKLEALADETGNKMALKVDESGNAPNSQAKKTNAAKKDEKKGIKDSLAYDS
jgi:hypothetical protein